MHGLISTLRFCFYRLQIWVQSMFFVWFMDPKTVQAYLDSHCLYEEDFKGTPLEKQNKLQDWYKVVNHLCYLGGLAKMYIPPVLNEKVGVQSNQILFEKQLIQDLGILNIPFSSFLQSDDGQAETKAKS